MKSQLVEICDPLFLTVCETERLAFSRGAFPAEEAGQVQARIGKVLTDCQTQATRIGCRANWDRVEPPLCCFVDSMMEGLGGEFARAWGRNRIAVTLHRIQAGDAAFHQIYLDPDLISAEASPRPLPDDLRQRLEVYLACILLGFEGSLRTFPLEIGKKRERLAYQVPEFLGGESKGKYTPETYERVLARKLQLDTAPAYLILVVVLVAFVGTYVFFTGKMYKDSVNDLNRAIQTVNTTPIKGGQ